MRRLPALPIDEAVPDLLKALAGGPNAVLVAPPGAGKTTRVPLALLDEAWLNGGKIIMLEPRRLAARSAAAHMASLLGEKTGETVGYRVRLDTKVSAATRIEVVTEGVLTRMLQSDPSLEGVGAILFDEFHERHLHGDLGLALCLQAQSLLREDLRLLVMSATLEAAPVARLLGDAPIIESEGRAFPVQTIYSDRQAGFGLGALWQGESIEDRTARAVLRVLPEHEGDVLVFLPGMREMRRVESQLRQQGIGRGMYGSIDVVLLHGSMPLEEQGQAVAPSPEGRRKIVLATSIAESSITVEGVRVVIDSGMMRVPRFSPRTGMTRLETVTVSVPSADQRRGRAGRVAPGVCYRLWTEQEQLMLAPRSTPELLEADLAPLALELAAWGVSAPSELAWLDEPPAGAYASACELLQQLGAFDRERRLTPLGRRMAALGAQPRLARMLLSAAAISPAAADTACELAALLSGRDPLRGERSADIALRLGALRALRRGGAAPDGASGGVDEAAARQALAEARQWQRALAQDGAGASPSASRAASPHGGGTSAAPTPRGEAASSPAAPTPRGEAASSPRGHDGSHSARGNNASPTREPSIGALLAFAYPDRVGQGRGDGRFLLAGGRGAVLTPAQPLSYASYIAGAEMEDGDGESRIVLAADIEENELHAYHSDHVVEELSVLWDRSAQAVRARRKLMFGALVLKEEQVTKPDPIKVTAALLDGIRTEGTAILSWNKQSSQLRDRIRVMRKYDPELPDLSEEALLASLEDWLAPHLTGIRSRDGLQKLNMMHVLEAMLSWNDKHRLDELMPTHMTVPSGSRIPIDYTNPEQPVLAVKLQELFGLQETPRIAKGRLPLTLHLLSPAQRPVQVTQDLANFWRNTYFEVKKELKVRYPKHYWPDDPFAAVPTSRVRPRP
ncbi:ATP-dependent helicase HrpB [Paenibacillus cellulosilyticus]|uniref:ATP-dependent helicase HrpB n=1 Tax=Paenibacillus cellulosilyticus TaxID=375489 RepID=A0A2V2YY18_9BACL|nr:ATP-dependent helicase HrpB [Paenibacillus cellulosilyticus]PWW06514.1 ATP-dependent helicase HrpB [Paenibacillus cellulosilyticus]QKS46148.1 ATP-dependent helicase HrpB [Paenibacillus cellulosilyticus]